MSLGLKLVRYAYLNSDGTLSEGDEAPLSYWDGVVPMVGDVVAHLWSEDEYETAKVAKRFDINEFEGPSYWFLILERIATDKIEREMFKMARHKTSLMRDIKSENLSKFFNSYHSQKTLPNNASGYY